MRPQEPARRIREGPLGQELALAGVELDLPRDRQDVLDETPVQKRMAAFQAEARRGFVELIEPQEKGRTGQRAGSRFLTHGRKLSGLPIRQTRGQPEPLRQRRLNPCRELPAEGRLHPPPRAGGNGFSKEIQSDLRGLPIAGPCGARDFPRQPDEPALSEQVEQDPQVARAHELIPADTGEDRPAALLRHSLQDQRMRQESVIVRRVGAGDKQLKQRQRAVGGLRLDEVEVHLAALDKPLNGLPFFPEDLFIQDGKRLHRGERRMGSSERGAGGGDQRGVNPSAEQDACRRRGAKTAAHRVVKQVTEVREVVGFLAIPNRRGALGLPVSSPAQRPLFNAETVTGPELRDALEKGRLGVAQVSQQIFGDGQVVGPLGQIGNRPERVEGGREQQSAAVPMVVERLDADGIARAEQPPVGLVPDGEGEVADEA